MHSFLGRMGRVKDCKRSRMFLGRRHFNTPLTLCSVYRKTSKLHICIYRSQTLPKVQRTSLRVDCFHQSNCFKSYQILSKSTSWSKFSFWISTKLPLQKLGQIIASKNWTRIYSKSWPKFSFDILSQHSWPTSESASKSLPNCLLRSSASISAILTTSRSFELASSNARVTPIKSQQQEWVGELQGSIKMNKHTINL